MQCTGCSLGRPAGADLADGVLAAGGAGRSCRLSPARRPPWGYSSGTCHAAYRDLSDKARARVAPFLLDTVNDPWAATSPYGDVDDRLMRLWAAGDLAVVLLIGDQPRTITVLSIAYAALDWPPAS